MCNKKRFAVILAGCGVFDGAEIHEATLSLYAIVKNGGTYQVFAPNMEQHHVINHLTGEEMPEKRNVLVEAARIARGEIKDLKEFSAVDYDYLLLPGGFGVAKNLCSYAFDGVGCEVNPDVSAVVMEMYEAHKPIGALCIAPVLIARILEKVVVTIGQDETTAASITAMGGEHSNTDKSEIVVDVENKIVSAPCYMLDVNIADIGLGAEMVVKKLMELS